MAGGEGGSKLNTIDYITTASTGNATDFGDLNTAVQGAGGTRINRGLFAGGEPASGNTNVIDYITIASTGNGTDFGDLTVARAAMSCGSDAWRYRCNNTSSISSAAIGLYAGGRSAII